MAFYRTKFKDGIIYHDYHWNTMQYNIDAEIEKKTTINFYDIRLGNSNYKYSYVDPIVVEYVNNVTKQIIYPKGVLNNTTYNSDYMCIELSLANNGFYQSDLIKLPEKANEFVLLANDNIPEGTSITYQISIDEGETWVDIQKNQKKKMDITSLMLKVNFTKTSESTPPRLFDYCLMWVWKEETKFAHPGTRERN